MPKHSTYDWSTVAIAPLASLIPSITVATLGISLPEIRETLSLSEIQAGSLFSAIFIVAMVSSSVAGRISDRIGRKTVLVVGVASLSLGFALSGLSHSYALMLGLLGFAGLGYGIITPSLYSLMSDLLPDRRGLGASFVSVSYGTGGLVGPILASSIIAKVGWQASFFSLGFIGMIITILQIIVVKSPNRQTTQVLAPYTRAVNRSIVLLALAELIGGSVFWSTSSWTPTLLRTVKELTLQETGFVMAVWGATPMIGALLLGALSDRIGRKAVILYTTYPGALAAFVVYYLLVSPGALAVGLLIYGIFKSTVPTLVVALAQDSVSPESVGTATGMVMSMHYVAAFAAPLVAARLITGTGDMILTMTLTSTVPLILYGCLIALVREKKPVKP
ncbi:MAG: MFS transporter [Candidatus Binatia bacterium]